MRALGLYDQRIDRGIATLTAGALVCSKRLGIGDACLDLSYQQGAEMGHEPEATRKVQDRCLWSPSIKEIILGLLSRARHARLTEGRFMSNPPRAAA
jgi:hypothetical protein